MEKERCILVPYDFSNESNFAMEHAYEFAKKSALPIKLIHVVNSEKEIFDWKIEIEKVAKDFVKTHNIVVTTEVRAGNLYDTIYNYGLEVNTYLAVIGTHGIKTTDKVMKLVKPFMRIPFVLVQRPIMFGEYDKICCPITNSRYCRAKLQWVRHLDLLFKSKVILCPIEYKNNEQKKELTKNLQFATDLFAEYAIDFDIHNIPEKDVEDALYDYMYEIEPDIVLFMTDKYKQIIHDIQKPQNKELQKKILVMCVNNRTDIAKIGGFN